MAGELLVESVPMASLRSAAQSSNAKQHADVQITSYVNNLYPDHHTGLYRHLERLMAGAVSS